MSFALKELLEKYPESYSDRRMLYGLLKDCFPEQNQIVAALISIYDLKIHEEIKKEKALDALAVSRYSSLIYTNYGIAGELAQSALQMWAEAFGTVWDIDAEFSMPAPKPPKPQKKTSGAKMPKKNKLSSAEIKKYLDEYGYYTVFEAVCDNFSFLSENFREENNMLPFSKMFVQVFTYDKYFAVDVWQWVLDNFLGKINKTDDDDIVADVMNTFSMEELAELIRCIDGNDKLTAMVFGNAYTINYGQTDAFTVMLADNRLDFFNKAMNYYLLIEDKCDKKLGYLLENIIIRRECVYGLNDEKYTVLKALIERIPRELVRGRLLNELNRQYDEIALENKRTLEREERLKQAEISRRECEEARRNGLTDKRFNFSKLKEEAVKSRKENPIWHNARFITFTSVVGFYFTDNKDEVADEIKTDDELRLVREADNKYDSLAISVYDTKNRKLGYIPKESNTFLATSMDNGDEFIARLYHFELLHGNANIAIEVFKIIKEENKNGR